MFPKAQNLLPFMTQLAELLQPGPLQLTDPLCRGLCIATGVVSEFLGYGSFNKIKLNNDYPIGLSKNII